MNDAIDLESWIGRTETVDDVATAAPLAGLAALLDHETPPWTENEVAPLGHWLYFLPRARQSLIGPDGHPHRGGFLPPVTLPRRMWAGSRVRFERPIPIGAEIQRRSTIANVASKSGRSGSMVFVTVRHEINFQGRCAIREEQDIVYREMPGGADGAASSGATGTSATGAAGTAVAGTAGTVAAGAIGTADAGARGPTAPVRPSQWTREVTAGPVELFRFSALTFNAHRIHYDREYTREIEGYAKLVVHGPLVAILLMDHFLRRVPKVRVTGFTFRAQRPLHDSAPFSLCLDARERSAELWSVCEEGQTTMTATVEFEPRD
jgi:3-methylfumaryl-CoA hydratase